VNRRQYPVFDQCFGIPHARGGEPQQKSKPASPKPYSPRTWG
jgi:hypothetical protein